MDSPVRILYVDDDENDRILFAAALEESCPKCLAHFVSDRAAALHWMDGKKGSDDFPHLVVSDGNLRCDGGSIGLIHDIRKSFPLLPVLVFSANPMQDRVDQFYAAGANGFVYKGTGFDQFSRQLAQLVDYWTRVLILPSRPR